MICPKCTTENPEGAKFCAGCFTSLEEGKACPKCGAINLPEAAFCTACGASLELERACPKCGAANPFGAAFCTSCGASLEQGRVCSKCGAANPPEAAFCTGCGARLGVEAPTPPPVAPARPAVAPAPPPVAPPPVAAKPAPSRRRWLVPVIIGSALLIGGGIAAFMLTGGEEGVLIAKGEVLIPIEEAEEFTTKNDLELKIDTDTGKVSGSWKWEAKEAGEVLKFNTAIEGTFTLGDGDKASTLEGTVTVRGETRIGGEVEKLEEEGTWSAEMDKDGNITGMISFGEDWPFEAKVVSGSIPGEGEGTAGDGDREEGIVITEVKVPINLEDASNVGSLHIELVYGPSVLEVKKVEAGNLAQNAMIESNLGIPGRVIIGIIDATGINGDGSVVVVSFEIVGEGSSYLTLENPEAYAAETLSSIMTTVTVGSYQVDGNKVTPPVIAFGR